MTLIVETGAGVAGADSYLSVSEADAIIATRQASASPTWAALTEQQKENALRHATEQLDLTFVWKGTQQFIDGRNNLRWPRSGASDVYDIPIPGLSIPHALKMAVAYTAVANVLSEGTTSPSPIQRVKLDVLEIEYESASTPVTPASEIMGAAELHLIGLYYNRLTGARQFARIVRT